MNKLFGTDGIRGRVNQPPMTVDIISSVGKSAAVVLFNHLKTSPRVLIGKDTRLSGYAFEYAISAGLIAGGSDVFFAGPIPTPAVAFLTTSLRLDAGVVISASHNPYHDNGIKFFNRDGYKLSDEVEGEIERLVLSGEIQNISQDPVRMGKAHRITDARGRYVEFLKSTFSRHMNLKGVKLALDCANGSTYWVAPVVFSELEADVIAFNVEPDGININAGCGSTVPEFIIRKTIEEGADVGIAFDGDGDRVLMVDDQGNLLDGDDIIAVLVHYFKEKGLITGGAVVGTVMSNMGLERYLKSLGLKFIRAKVGDRYVVEEMNRSGAIIGGEESGHIVLRPFTTTGDGILTALQVLKIMVEENRPLSSIRKIIHKFPQVRGSIRISKKVPLDEIPGWSSLKADQERVLKDKGRILVRYSGTEPLLRIMVEAESEGLAQKVYSAVYEFFDNYFSRREEVEQDEAWS